VTGFGSVKDKHILRHFPATALRAIIGSPGLRELQVDEVAI
jgi:hypothetical protein